MPLIATGTAVQATPSVYSHTIKLVQHDTSPELNITLKDVTDSIAVDTSNVVSIVLKFRPLAGGAIKATLPMYRVAPYTSGKIFMQWPIAVVDSDGVSTSALDTAGIFTGEVELTYNDGKIQTVFDELKFEVRGDY